MASKSTLNRHNRRDVLLPVTTPSPPPPPPPPGASVYDVGVYEPGVYDEAPPSLYSDGTGFDDGPPEGDAAHWLDD